MNGVYWWPEWASKKQSRPLPCGWFFPQDGRKLKILGKAGRGKVSIRSQTPEKIVVRYDDVGKGAAELNARFAFE